MKIKDLNNRILKLKILPVLFVILNYHSHGTSLHEENGFFLKLMINSGNLLFSLPNKENNK